MHSFAVTEQEVHGPDLDHYVICTGCNRPVWTRETVLIVEDEDTGEWVESFCLDCRATDPGGIMLLQMIYVIEPDDVTDNFGGTLPTVTADCPPHIAEILLERFITHDELTCQGVDCYRAVGWSINEREDGTATQGWDELILVDTGREVYALCEGCFDRVRQRTEWDSVVASVTQSVPLYAAPF